MNRLNRLFLLAAFGVTCASNCFAQTATINFATGQLLMSDGTTFVPNGCLLQIVASGADGTFSTPLPGQYVSGDDVLLASFFLDTSTTGGTPGSTFAALTFNFAAGFTIGGYNAQAVAGQTFELVWYPTISTFTNGALTLGSTYGVFRSATIQPGSDIAWVVPAAGTTNGLQFLTASLGGPNPNSAGTASFTVVPEPASLALTLLGGAAVLGAAFQRRRAHSITRA